MAVASPPTTFLATARGKLTLALLCSIAFLDFVDASIVNVALPDIRAELGLSVSALQWVPGAYLLTYGGFMLLGGRAADLVGRRPVLVAGVVTIGVASLVGGFADSEGVLIGARLVQGLGAAMTLPAALSVLTTSFAEGGERNTALGAWGAMAGLASAAGVLIGGVLTDGPGWRWVMFVNPIACALVLVAIYRLIEPDRKAAARSGADVSGALLVTGGVMLLVFTLVEAPDTGWDTARTIGGLTGAAALVLAFVVNEMKVRHPIAPLGIFRINGLANANGTQMIAASGFISMFFFLTLYMQNVLGYSPLKTGLAYVPLCLAIIVAAGLSSQVLNRVGTRALIVGGSVVAAGAMYWLSRAPVDGSFTADLLGPTVLVALGFGPVFVAATTAANAGVAPDKAGLAASLFNASQQLGGAIGLAVLTTVATSHTQALAAGGSAARVALHGGLQRALLVAAFLIAAAAVIGLRATQTRGEEEPSRGAAHTVEPAGSAS